VQLFTSKNEQDAIGIVLHNSIGKAIDELIHGYRYLTILGKYAIFSVQSNGYIFAVLLLVLHAVAI